MVLLDERIGPRLVYCGLAILGGIVAALWLIALVAGSTFVTIVIAILTAVIAGGLFWAWRMFSKQKAMMELLQSASASPEARQQAIAQLEGQGGDAMALLARAQLEAQDAPDKALATLESINLAKAPDAVAGEVRAVRAQLYLFKGKLTEARDMADAIRPGEGSGAQSRAMLTAVVAEAWARTGKHDAALTLLADVNLDDAEIGQAKLPVLFARVFAQFAAGKRDKARKDLETLMKIDVNLLGRYAMPGQRVHPELQKLAQEVLRSHPDMKRMMRQQQQQSFRRVR